MPKFRIDTTVQKTAVDAATGQKVGMFTRRDGQPSKLVLIRQGEPVEFEGTADEFDLAAELIRSAGGNAGSFDPADPAGV